MSLKQSLEPSLQMAISHQGNSTQLSSWKHNTWHFHFLVPAFASSMQNSTNTRTVDKAQQDSQPNYAHNAAFQDWQDTPSSTPPCRSSCMARRSVCALAQPTACPSSTVHAGVEAWRACIACTVGCRYCTVHSHALLAIPPPRAGAAGAVCVTSPNMLVSSSARSHIRNSSSL